MLRFVDSENGSWVQRILSRMPEGVDPTLIAESLRLTPGERLARLQAMVASVESVRTNRDVKRGRGAAMTETALVTGASGGIGEDIARLLAVDRRNVVLLARSAGKLQALADALRRAHNITAPVVVQDLSQPSAADAVAEALARQNLTIDILVNNAGLGTRGPFATADASETVRMLNVNIVALTMLTRHLLPGMVERRRGRILNVASTAAFQPGPFMATYYASKAYVLSFSEALSTETEGTGVTVTCLCPGPTQTGFQSTAKMEQVRLLRVFNMMSSADVARAGYEGMMAGRAIVVPGMMNKLVGQLGRISPRSLSRKVTGALNTD
jgi:short-subunit dehydrogenase